MTLRIVGSALLAAALLLGCPPPGGKDGGVDASTPPNPSPDEACTGGCAVNQVCDVAAHACVDACGGCDAGQCIKLGPNSFQCQLLTTTCNGQACSSGQVACLNNACACISSAQGAQDSCSDFGKWCSSGTCGNPKVNEQCVVNGPACPMGSVCSDGFLGGGRGLCLRSCSGNGSCGRGEGCFNLGGGVTACLALGVSSAGKCQQNVPLPADAGVDGGLLLDGGFVDGGFPVYYTALSDGGIGPKVNIVAAGNTCVLLDGSGVPTEPVGLGSGNCIYESYRLWNDGLLNINTCRPPGTAQEGQECKVNEFGVGTVAQQCGTGLACAPVRGSDRGVCMRMCNANPPRLGYQPQPACNTDEACVNYLRYVDPFDNAVQGVCMPKCNVFTTGQNTCSSLGPIDRSCVATPPAGTFVVSTDGSGVCMPQQITIAALGASCSERDPFLGAVCASGQVCVGTGGAGAKCTQVCDLTCSPTDGGAGPARCNSQPNSRCAAGKACTRRTSTTGTTLGLCE